MLKQDMTWKGLHVGYLWPKGGWLQNCQEQVAEWPKMQWEIQGKIQLLYSLLLWLFANLVK